MRIEDRVCKECGDGEVADVDNYVIRCWYVEERRERMERFVSNKVKGWNELGNNEKIVGD